VQSFLSIAPIVAASDLIAPVPANLASAVAGHLGLRVCPAPFPLPGFDVSLYWHQRAHCDPANMWLRQELMDSFKDARHLINQ
jgi:DNA-binding transcriptional LysR family regulator